MSDLPDMPEPIGYVPFAGEFYRSDELDQEVKNEDTCIWCFDLRQMQEQRISCFNAGQAKALKDAERLRHAGAMLANCAFNLAQRNPGQFTARDIETLDQCRKAWDEAIRSMPTPPAAMTKEKP